MTPRPDSATFRPPTSGRPRGGRILSWLLTAALMIAGGVGPVAASTETADPFSSHFDDVYLEALDVLAVEDDAARAAILEASLHPETVGEIRSVQLQSSTSFRELLAGMAPYDQARIWELTRYPELVEELVIGGPRPNVEQLERQARALSEIPEDVRDEVRGIASWIMNSNFKLLEEVWAIHADAEYAYHEVLSTRPAETQASFRVLIDRPELMNTLVLNPDLVGKLGELYREHPNHTRDQFAHYAADLGQRDNVALSQWQQVLVEDPAAREELRESALEFAQETGLPSPEAPVEEYAYESPPRTRAPQPSFPFWWGSSAFVAGVVSGVSSHHSHWGFHFNNDGGMVVFGVPSREFRRWYGNRRSHHRRGGYGSRPYSRYSERWHGSKRRHGGKRHAVKKSKQERRKKKKARARRQARKRHSDDGSISRPRFSKRSSFKRSFSKRSAFKRSHRHDRPQRSQQRQRRGRRGRSMFVKR